METGNRVRNSRRCFQEVKWCAVKSGSKGIRNGYRRIRKPGGGSVPEHVIVVERAQGTKVQPDQSVHHVDGDKLNNSPSNLIVMSRSEHSRLHAIWRSLDDPSKKRRIKRKFESLDASEPLKMRTSILALLMTIRQPTADDAIAFLWNFYCERRKIEKKEEKQRTRELEMNLALVQATLEATQKLPQPDPEEEPRT